MDKTVTARIARMRDLDLDGGHLALDFANTVDWRNTEGSVEWLADYLDVAAWAVRVGLIGAPEAESLARRASADSAGAAKAHRRLLALREAMFRVFEATVRGQPVPTPDLALLNEWLARSVGQSELRETGAGFEWSFRQDQSLEAVVYPVVRAAADLLVGSPAGRLKKCATPECSWFFVDSSKNNSRRWCDMQSCGNRAKARRHYRKVRSRQGRSRGPAAGRSGSRRT